jgi:hypothetical protein
MLPINQDIVKVKNLIGIIDEPQPEDLLFEICSFLENEQRFDGEFKSRDVYHKCRIRLTSEIRDDMEILINLAYIRKVSAGVWIVLRHLWEDTTL